LYYSDFIDTDDSWSGEIYQKFLQAGGDLGEKMESAFRSGFKAGYTAICIVGTDCLELTGKIVKEAFLKLLTHEVVIGPAVDGGYYLLGMKCLQPALFKNKNWGTGTVLTQTLDDIKLLGLSCWQLQPLNDVDRIEDLPPDFQLDNQSPSMG
jgi:rSAM/selenodomain-associated transferase 1